MRIRSQILLLLVLIVAIFVGGVSLIKHEEMSRVQSLTEQTALDLNLAFDHYLIEREHPLEKSSRARIFAIGTTSSRRCRITIRRRSASS